MSPTLSFIIKETRHITRDRRTMLILFGMPVVMMLLFGFAIRTDLQNVNLAVVTSSMDNRTQQIIDRLNASEYFTVTHCVGTPEEAHGLIVARKADMAVAFTPGFANHRYDATAGIQLITDYTDPNTGEMQNVYVQQIISVALASPAAVKTVPPVNSRLLYNPQMKSAYNFVPGIMGMLLILICAMMTSVSIVREKERGTMEVLLASPVRPIVIIIAKAIPYMLLSIGILISILVISKYVLAVPLTGSLWALFGLSLLYIAGVGIGIAHQYHCRHAVGSTLALGNGIAFAQSDVIRNDLSYREYACHSAISVGYCACPMVHFGCSQIDDNGCWF